MRMRCIALALCAALFVSAGAASATVDSKKFLVTPEQQDVASSLTNNHGDVLSFRRLRTEGTPSTEERAMNLPGNSLVVKLLNGKAKPTLTWTEKYQVKKWVKKKEPMESIFKQLSLHGGIDKILTNKKLNQYVAYIDWFNNKNPKQKVTMVEMFRKTYGDEAVAKLVESRKNYLSSPKLVTRMRNELLRSWKADKKSSDEVFTMLSLEKAQLNLFESPQLNTWYTYTTYTLGKDPAAAVSVLVTHYGYPTLSKIFLAAQPKTIRMRTTAMDMETAMTREWIAKGYFPAKIFMLLKLNTGAHNLLNPNVARLAGYVEKFNIDNPEKATSVLKLFKNFYTEEALVKALEAGQTVYATKKRATYWLKQLSNST
ncbi:unnamed protein product [Phytophthora lilii]|uniref:RxLR effector protein n=1 Tax=Phytophthora lilii TaxID=2077276 RepID=A0A9W6UBP6_9STRA|nr:unnamed protein product [Phytophthora lilii]